MVLMIVLTILIAEINNPTIVLAESCHNGCSPKVYDYSERDRVTIRLDNLDLPKGTKLKVYSGMRDSKKPIKIVYTSIRGDVEFEIPNYAKNEGVAVVEYIRFKLANGSGLNYKMDGNQWICFKNIPGSCNLVDIDDPIIGIVMFPNLPIIPLSFFDKENKNGLMKPGKHPEIIF